MADSGLAELDREYYRNANPDLQSLALEELEQHYLTFGIHEGRASSHAARREGLIEMLGESASVLEIGPFLNPVMRGRRVRYFDVLDTAGLKARAAIQNYRYSDAPEIDYVSPAGDLSIIKDRFASLLSAHCIEHQPDIVRHLRQAGGLLQPGGRYYLIVPDKRYCFDHFIAESTVAGMIDAYSEERRIHRLASVIEHRALTTHNDPARHWNGDHTDTGYIDSIPQRTRAAMAEYAAAGGAYVDVHAWQFTPASFRHTMTTLSRLGLSPFDVTAVHGTPRPRNEFTAILARKGTSG